MSCHTIYCQPACTLNLRTAAYFLFFFSSRPRILRPQAELAVSSYANPTVAFEERCACNIVCMWKRLTRNAAAHFLTSMEHANMQLPMQVTILGVQQVQVRRCRDPGLPAPMRSCTPGQTSAPSERAKQPSGQTSPSKSPRSEAAQGPSPAPRLL